MIEQAVADGETLVVILWSKDETIPWYEREEWIYDVFHDADLTVGQKQDELPVDFNDVNVSRQHARLIEEVVREYSYDGAIDKVFGSEIYVDHLAEYFGAQPVCLDPERIKYPISGTEIRQDIRKGWKYLAPKVRNALCKRVVCIGAESCGTTTLARDLAKHYDTVWVPEYGRLYSEGVWGHGWNHEDLWHIWDMQGALEEQLARRSRNGLLICDTNQLATKVWSQFLVGSSGQLYDGRPPDLYLLTDFCPWEDDNLREGEHYRADMQIRFVEEIEQSGVPWACVEGDPAQRLQQAINRISLLDWSI